MNRVEKVSMRRGGNTVGAGGAFPGASLSGAIDF